ncbi:hypothetical protein M407DRAFT_6887 [Tulasnella calospora MUT 4182]|uniref:Uncharacterized protein n=1 Tax=Tulasnella calospora MUT 4182 TaxID=1051891 RepID=A0A0C3QC70_9AGAM|nr:hypothetical protein M407DRAFT_6887 [Tulasnella calospora MUT 4182]
MTLLNSWQASFQSKRWFAVMDPRVRESDRVFALKSVFNEVWDAFDVHQLQHVVQEQWVKQDIPSASRSAGSLLGWFAKGRPSTAAGEDELAPSDFEDRPILTHPEGSVGPVDGSEADTLARNLVYELGERKVDSKGMKERTRAFKSTRFLVSKCKANTLGDVMNHWRQSVLAVDDEWKHSGFDQYLMDMWNGVWDGQFNA